MQIQRTTNQIVITLPLDVDIDGLQRLLNFLVYREITSKSRAKQEDANELARTFNKNWWDKNKHKFLGE